MRKAGGLCTVIADQHSIFLSGLARVLQDADVHVTAAASEPAALSAALAGERADAVVLGLAGPATTDSEWFDVVAESRSACRVLALTDLGDSTRVGGCIRAGIRSVAARAITPHELVAGVGIVAAGQSYFSAGAVEAMVHEMARLSLPPLGALTPRELEILRMLADGLKAPAIASALVIERTTVRTHLHHLFEKLGVSNQAGAVAEAMRRGLLA
jgi:two-component system, NarL family, nitrate/nitrite response regulator NarL